MSTQSNLASAEPSPSQHTQDLFSLTRLIYSLCGAVVLYMVLRYASAYLLRALSQKYPYLLNRMDISFYGSNPLFYASDLFFALASLVVIVSYRPKSELFFWRSSASPSATGVFLSSFLGIGYGLGALIVASPLFWIGDWRVGTLWPLNTNELSGSNVLAILAPTIALAVLTEIVCRGIVLKTLNGHVSTPAAIFGSAVLFAAVYPILGFPTAMIVGFVSGILYYRTRNLLAPIMATVVFTLSGAALSLYHLLSHLGSERRYFSIGRC